MYSYFLVVGLGHIVPEDWLGVCWIIMYTVYSVRSSAGAICGTFVLELGLLL